VNIPLPQHVYAIEQALGQQEAWNQPLWDAINPYINQATYTLATDVWQGDDPVVYWVEVRCRFDNGHDVVGMVPFLDASQIARNIPFPISDVSAGQRVFPPSN